MSLERPDELDERWIWMAYTHRLNQRLHIIPEQIYGMNFIECLNWLSYFKDFDAVAKAQEDKKQGKIVL